MFVLYPLLIEHWVQKKSSETERQTSTGRVTAKTVVSQYALFY